MVGLVEKRYDIPQDEKAVYPEILLFHGKRGFLSYLGDIQPKIFGIWMKQGVFGVYSQNMVLEGRAIKYKGGEKAKQRFTIALMANAAGGKESAIVVLKLGNPSRRK